MGALILVVVVVLFAVLFLAIRGEWVGEAILVEQVVLSSSRPIAAVDAEGGDDPRPVLDLELVEDVGGAGLPVLDRICARKQQ